MSWSYNELNINTDTELGRLNVVRLLIGDTDEENPQMQNEEISFFLSQNSNNTYKAAYSSAVSLANKYASKADISIEDHLEIKYSQLAENYNLLATRLEKVAKSGGATLGAFATGINKTKMQLVITDPNWNGFFYEDMGSYDDPLN